MSETAFAIELMLDFALERLMLELYYFHDATCGIKARLTLFEKGVEFERRVLDRFELTSAEYLAVNPQGVVPTLVHNGVSIFESSVICLYVDDGFDGPSLKPVTPIDRARMYAWLKKIDEYFFKGIGSITFALAIRKQLLDRYPNEESLEAYFSSIKIEEYRHRRRSIVRSGLDAPEFKDGIKVLAAMIEQLERALEFSPFAAGPDYSIADACLTPFLMRLDVFGLDKMWQGHPKVTDWWSRMQERKSFNTLVAESFPNEYFTDMRDLVGDVWPQINTILQK